MFRRILNCTGVALLLLSPASAQFGVAGGRKKGSSFQELNEKAKEMQGSGGMEDLLGNFDPSALEALGDQMEEIMKMMAEMPPEELEKQMKDAMEMLQGDEMMKHMLANQDEMLKVMEESGQIDKEELEKFKTDPEYFEQKMKESFGQMQELFADPEIMQTVSKSMKGLQDMYNNPAAIEEAMKSMYAGLDDEEKIEEVRQMLLNNPEDFPLPGFKEIFDTPEMKEMLSDPTKFRASVKEGLAGGAGVGEL